jgi:hypothetical protein
MAWSTWTFRHLGICDRVRLKRKERDNNIARLEFLRAHSRFLWLLPQQITHSLNYSVTRTVVVAYGRIATRTLWGSQGRAGPFSSTRLV